MLSVERFYPPPPPTGTPACLRGRKWGIVSGAKIRLSEWRLKLVLSIPSVSIFAISIAKIRHPSGTRIIRDN